MFRALYNKALQAVHLRQIRQHLTHRRAIVLEQLNIFVIDQQKHTSNSSDLLSQEVAREGELYARDVAAEVVVLEGKDLGIVVELATC